MKKDLVVYTIILTIVLSSVVGLYVYDSKTNVLGQFSKDLFHRLIS